MGHNFIIKLLGPNEMELYFSLENNDILDMWIKEIQLQVNLLSSKEVNPELNLQPVEKRRSTSVIRSFNTFEGYATKRGHFFYSWKVRWFSLENNKIKYYKDKSKSSLKGIFEIYADTHCATSSVLLLADAESYRHIIHLKSTRNELYFSIDSYEIQQEWSNIISNQIKLLHDKDIK